MNFTTLLAWVCAPTELQALEIWRQYAGVTGQPDKPWLVTNQYQIASAEMMRQVRGYWLLWLPLQVSQLTLRFKLILRRYAHRN